MESALASEKVVLGSAELEAQTKKGHRHGYKAVLGGILACLFFVYCASNLTSRCNAPHYVKTDLSFGSAELEMLGQKFSTDASLAESIFLENPSTELLGKALHAYTKHPHLAGNLALARYTRDKWLAAGIQDVEIVEYEVLLNYPTNQSRVSLYNGKQHVWDATLQEDVLPEDPGSGEAIPFFHGYSKNGSAAGPLVYLNYGRPEDFAAAANHVDLRGKIGIARYGKLFRGLKVELAQQHEMSAILLYDDPSEDRHITVENGYKAYPHGPARNPSAVQRGSVQFLSILPGDPSTPGYASIPGCHRQDPYKSIPSIPSIPINGRDAQYLLATLNGQGPVLDDFLGAFPNVKYNLGGESSSHFSIKLDNVVEYDYRPIYNVIAKLPGHFDDTIILGNHRDAWVRGASDPSSGSSALDSIVETFAALSRTGYVPLRTLMFASWDAEEYGLVGSTEYVEEHVAELSKHAIAYLNVDVASSGTHFKASASPFLFDILRHVTARVPAVRGDSAALPGVPPVTSLRDEWHGRISTLGSGSDYTAFQDALGISSIDMGFSESDAVYHYHSQYDSLHWLTKFGDPHLKALQAATRVWGLLAYRLAESPVIAFNATTYALQLLDYMDQLPEPLGRENSRLRATGRSILHYARDLDARAGHANALVQRWVKLRDSERTALLRDVRALNEEYKHFERALLDPRGLVDRPFFKHILYAPGRWTGYAGAVFPSITEATTPAEAKSALARVHKILKKVGRQ